MTVEHDGHARRWHIPASMAAVFLTGAMVSGAVDAAEPSTAPPRERYGDWEVVCAMIDKATRCLAMQRQATAAASGGGVQRVLAMELVAVPDGAVGTLLTPFGVDLASGLVLKFSASGPPLPFKTCLPTGCVVPLQFGKQAVRSLRKETLLHVSFVTAGDRRNIDLPVSLNGLGQALDRASVLDGEKHQVTSP